MILVWSHRSLNGKLLKRSDLMTENMYKREIAWRVFSDDLKNVEIVERADEEFAPSFVITASGARVNRVFIVGTLLNIEDVGSGEPFWKLRISDPKGIFNANIGQYSPIQPQDMAESLEAPTFVAIVAKVKPNSFNDKVSGQLAVESITVVDTKTYDRWVDETTNLTKARMEKLSNDA